MLLIFEVYENTKESGTRFHQDYIFESTDIASLNEMKELSNDKKYRICPLDKNSADTLFRKFRTDQEIFEDQIAWIEITKECIEIIPRTTEVLAREWIFIEELERAGTIRKIDLIRKIKIRLDPIRHFLKNAIPLDINDISGSADRYYGRLEGIFQKYDKPTDGMNGKNCISRNGIEGIKFNPGGCEKMKDLTDYNDKGLTFLEILRDLDRTSDEYSVSISDIIESALKY